MMGFSDIVTILMIIVLGIIYVRLSDLEKRLTASLRLDPKLDALLKHAGIQFDLRGSLPQEAVQALERGKKIEAIIMAERCRVNQRDLTLPCCNRSGSQRSQRLYRRGSATTQKRDLTKRLLSSLSQI